METYHVIGLMSGTSLDGVDIAYCSFKFENKWRFSINKAESFSYPAHWISKLKSWYECDASVLAAADFEYGQYLGALVKNFINRHHLQPDFIASHGHTIFHQPRRGFTLQIGNGNAIAAETGLPVIYDFRSMDLALGGQGAPLVPIGDRLLFSDFEYCLNLGGFANISFEKKTKRIAYDICPVNIVLNQLSQREGKDYDKDGMMARSGKLIQDLFDLVNQLEYYQKEAPKSLGREWVDANILPLLDQYMAAPSDLLATWTHHVAYQVSRSVNAGTGGRMLVTGGGAMNAYLVELIRSMARLEIIIPDVNLIHFKEALIFAFLGVLRWRNEINCLSSVTGAKKDSSSGVIVKG